ncbi:hypothetical protein CUR178_08349 [Leishmania enriettii]|uniref:Leucine-rich repeat protein n=1 Tax=Leishmania enriettii TaxID=5663 RepID=A0A836KV69_LEIEN|nr:hypothetical protein CUR178_08349 [Leishmania enriettii]
MSVAASSSRGSGGSEEVEVCGRGRGIRAVDLPAVFTTPQERGMLCVITAFDISRNELQELTNLQPLRSLTRLNASYNRICFVEGLPLRLTQLNLAHNKLEHLDHVSQLVHLRELDVSFNRLTSLAGLHPRIPLEVLRADDNRIDRTGGLKGLRYLRVASLSNNYVGDLDELLFVSTTPSLQLLNLIGNPVARARRYRQTLAELQPSLVSLDGAPLTRAGDYEITAHSSRVKSSDAPAAAAHASVPVSTATLGTARPQRALAYGSRDPAGEALAAVEKPPETPSAAVKNLDSSSHDSSSRRGRCGGVAQSVVAHGSISPASVSHDDSYNARPRDQPPQPARRAAANLRAGAFHRPAIAVARAALPSDRGGGAEPPHDDLSASESPRGPTESSARVEQRREDVRDTNGDVPPAVEGSSRGCRVADASLRTPEHSSRHIGYASLHSSPAKGVAADRLRNNGRVCPFPSPASARRSAASQQDLDATTAQLHDSLVAKEQLEKECQTLRRASKRLEGQLAEARRVISQQLAELSQLRLERDALRQSEGAVLERLEKERRSGRTRASHHSEEVTTLQAQYERMKAFYETQLADTRRELAAERARLLRRSNSDSGGERRAVTSHSNGVAERESKPLSSDQAQRPEVTVANAKSEPAAAAPATLLRSVPLAPPPAPSSTAITGNDALFAATSSTGTVAQQLTSWLYASLTGDGHAAESDESVGAAAFASELCKSLLLDSSTTTTALANEERPSQRQESADVFIDSGDTRAAAARQLLEKFIAQHIGQTTRVPQQIVSCGVHAESPTTAGAPVDAPTQGDAASSTISQVHESVVKIIEASEPAVVCPPPQQRPSPSYCSSPPTADQASVKDDDEAVTDPEVTVIISAPVLSTVAGTDRRVADATLSVPPRLPTPTRDRRVSAAKALLKGMEPLFDS